MEEEKKEVKQEEELKEDNKLGKLQKRSKLPYIIIALLLVIIVILVILLLLSQESNKKEENKGIEQQEQQEEQEEQEQLTEIDKSDEEVKKYFNIYKMNDTFDQRYLDLLNNNNNNTKEIEDAKFYIAYRQIKKEEMETAKCGDFTDINYHENYCGKMSDEMEKYNSGDDRSKFKEAEKNNTTTVFKGEILKNYYEKIFGKGTFTKYIEYIGTNPAGGYSYSPNKNMYVNSNFEGGGEEFTITQEIEKALKSDNKLILIIKANIESYDEQIINEKVKLTLKLEKETGNYIFESREVIVK